MAPRWLSRIRPLGKGASERDNVLVFGTGRSGTTWLSEIIASGGLRFVFEPLHPGEVPEARNFPFPNYLLPGEETPWLPLLEKVVTGRVTNAWTVRANPSAERSVVKLIRANLMMEWMIDRFRFHPVYIIRNPLSVAGSMKEQGWDVGVRYVQRAMEHIRAKDGSFDNLEELFERPITKVESYAIMWGFQNAIPIRRRLLKKVVFIRFEELAADPEGIFEPLARRIRLDMTPAVREQLHKLSFQRGKQSWEKGYDPTTAWKRSLTRREVKDVIRIVRWFGLEDYLVLD